MRCVRVRISIEIQLALSGRHLWQQKQKEKGHRNLDVTKYILIFSVPKLHWLTFVICNQRHTIENVRILQAAAQVRGILN